MQHLSLRIPEWYGEWAYIAASFEWKSIQVREQNGETFKCSTPARTPDAIIAHKIRSSIRRNKRWTYSQDRLLSFDLGFEVTSQDFQDFESVLALRPRVRTSIQDNVFLCTEWNWLRSMFRLVTMMFMWFWNYI